VCTSCHDLDVIVSQRLPKERWQSLVQDMVDRGAPLKEDEVKILVEYLAKSFPPETDR
jgi:polyhydroxyalkanoate synthesis regulator phasin